METLRWKTRVALLWILAAAGDLAHGLLVVWEPGGQEKMISRLETMGSGALLFEAVFPLIPLWMAFLAITIKDPWNKWVNLFLGIAFTVINVFHFFLCSVPLIEGGPVSGPTPHHILLVGSTVVATALIAWYAWKWPVALSAG